MKRKIFNANDAAHFHRFLMECASWHSDCKVEAIATMLALLEPKDVIIFYNKNTAWTDEWIENIDKEFSYADIVLFISNWY